MTTYYIEYKLTPLQKNLLRDLLVYLISDYDSKIRAGGTCPYIARRDYALDFLSGINESPLGGDDSITVMMEDVIKLCTPVSEDVSKMDKGIVGILRLYPNDVIEGLKCVLEDSESVMTSTSHFSF